MDKHEEHPRHAALYRQKIGDLEQGQCSSADITPSEAWKINRVARQKVAKQQRKITELRAAGQERKAKKEVRRFLHSWHAKLVAANEAVCVPAEERDRRFEQVWQIASQLNFTPPRSFEGCHTKKKGTGGTRTIYRFSTQERAHQKLVALAIEPFLGSLPTHLRWQGRASSVENLQRMVEEAGEDYVFVHVDVRGFFGSINHGWLEENLPLPVSLRRTVHTEYLNRSQSSCSRQVAERQQENEMDGRSGIPEGSALSPLVAEFVMADILQECSPTLEGLSYVIYSDNLGVMCRAEESERLVQSLGKAFRRHPAGPFQIRSSVTRLEREFRYLGYTFQRQEYGSCKVFVPRDTWVNRRNFYLSRMWDSRSREQFDRCVAKFRSYAHAFQDCPFHRIFLRHMEALARKVAADKEDLGWVQL